jgi:hypothetical protein
MSVFDADFCENCYKEFEMNVSVACLVETSLKAGSGWMNVGESQVVDIDHMTPEIPLETGEDYKGGISRRDTDRHSSGSSAQDTVDDELEDVEKTLSEEDVEGSVISGEIDVEGSVISGEIDVEGSVISGEIDVEGSVISGEIDDNVDIYGVEEVDELDDTLEASTVLQTSDGVQWEGNYMCTCEECLKGLRIERIVTADKSTMCPEDPPYVLMCEICEE